jgi:hypothetical protein
LFWLSFWTVAVNCWAWDVSNAADGGDMETIMDSGAEFDAFALTWATQPDMLAEKRNSIKVAS